MSCVHRREVLYFIAAHKVVFSGCWSVSYYGVNGQQRNSRYISLCVTLGLKYLSWVMVGGGITRLVSSSGSRHFGTGSLAFSHSKQRVASSHTVLRR